jgi:hypothetical protein
MDEGKERGGGEREWASGAAHQDRTRVRGPRHGHGAGQGRAGQGRTVVAEYRRQKEDRA